MINEIYQLVLKSNIRYLHKVWTLLYEIMDGWNHNIPTSKHKTNVKPQINWITNHSITYKQVLSNIDHSLLLVAVEKVKCIYVYFHIF